MQSPRLSRTDVLAMSVELGITAIGYLWGGPIAATICLAASGVLFWRWYTWEDRPGAPPAPTVSVEVLTSKLVPDAIGLSVDGGHREAHTVFMLVRCAHNWKGNLSLSDARLNVSIPGRKTTTVRAAVDNQKFDLQENFVRDEPIFGTRNDFRWVKLPTLVGRVLEPGMAIEGWVGFYLNSVSRNDLEMAPFRLSVKDALGSWHHADGAGLRDDTGTTIMRARGVAG